MKKFIEYFSLFNLYGVIYVLIEILYRGYSHWSMFLLGGICGILIGLINEIISWEMSFIFQCFIGGCIVTSLELLIGYIVNIKLGLNIWDYSNMWGNYLGQICPLFSSLWCILSGIVIVLDDWLRYWLFKEDRPNYKLI